MRTVLEWAVTGEVELGGCLVGWVDGWVDRTNPRCGHNDLGVIHPGESVLIIPGVLKNLRVWIIKVHLSLQLERFFAELGWDGLA